MSNLNTVEIKAFIPSKDFEQSKAFYSDLGFTKASEGGGVAYFYCGNCSFLLQDFYEPELADNFMMHLLVEDVDAWYESIKVSGLAEKYSVNLAGAVTTQPWKMRDFTLLDPSGVLWRIAQNID